MTNKLDAPGFRQMNIDEEKVDGVSFSINDEESNPDQTVWNFSLMTLHDEESKNFTKHELGYKYQIVLYKDSEAEIFEAIIGDVKNYVSNMVKASQEGLIIKKCKKSEEILNKIFRVRLMESLLNGLVRVAENKVA